MRQFLLLVAAALLGSALTYAWAQYSASADAPLPAPAAEIRLVNQAPPPLPPPGIDFREAARRATRAVVHIATRQKTGNDPYNFFFGRAEDPFEEDMVGSGVIFRPDGYILTNNHVVAESSMLRVRLSDNREFNATVIGTDKKSDLAVIRIDAAALPTLELANSDAAEIGEWVLAIGNPLDLSSTVTAGIISAKGRSLDLLEEKDAIESFIQTDAAVNPGNSGGALVDAQGRLLGINTAIATRTGRFQGYSFAIPINLARRVAEDIIDHGRFERGYLGVNIYSLDTRSATELAVPLSQGVVVDNVLQGSAADLAGLQARDIIIRVNDRIIRDVPDLTEMVGRSRMGETLEVVVWRDDQEMSFKVRLQPQ